MTAKEELIHYISTLTPEKVDKIISRLPQVILAIEEQAPPVPRSEISQNLTIPA